MNMLFIQKYTTGIKIVPFSMKTINFLLHCLLMIQICILFLSKLLKFKLKQLLLQIISALLHSCACLAYQMSFEDTLIPFFPSGVTQGWILWGFIQSCILPNDSFVENVHISCCAVTPIDIIFNNEITECLNQNYIGHYYQQAIHSFSDSSKYKLLCNIWKPESTFPAKPCGGLGFQYSYLTYIANKTISIAIQYSKQVSEQVNLNRKH